MACALSVPDHAALSAAPNFPLTTAFSSGAFAAAEDPLFPSDANASNEVPGQAIAATLALPVCIKPRREMGGMSTFQYKEGYRLRFAVDFLSTCPLRMPATEI